MRKKASTNADSCKYNYSTSLHFWHGQQQKSGCPGYWQKMLEQILIDVFNFVSDWLLHELYKQIGVSVKKEGSSF